jgi:murein L,D-transpeptidase YcbB/YkuD
MNLPKRFVLVFFPVALLVFLFSCNDHTRNEVKDQGKTVPATAGERVGTDLKSMLEYAAGNGDKLVDSTTLLYRKLVGNVYDSNGYTAIWSSKRSWKPVADSLFAFIDSCKYYGLFPSDYHFAPLAFIHRVVREDTLARKNEALWTRADLMLTDALFMLVKHLKQGRLDYDSVTLRKDSVLSDSVYTQTLAKVLGTREVAGALQELEPKHFKYDSLKTYLKEWLGTAHFRPLTWLEYPYKDTVAFNNSLVVRLRESGYVDSAMAAADTAKLAQAIRNYQTNNKLKVTGRANSETVTMMNNSDWEKFKRIAITMDRFKLLPDSLPRTYVWVNLPSFNMQVIDSDTVVLESKVIVGAPKTRTPQLTSEISNFVTYPQWTVPMSIIMKEMLPAIKNNVDYIRKQNLMVVDSRDSVRDPLTINWKRLNKNNFPYQLKQRQGDDNSLGVMKFNFRNKYDVYLHDTNGRWMFDNKFRALSHGCVRVQQWKKLSDFLIRNDTLKYHPDTLKAWIKRQEKHTIWGFAKVPIYLRYFTVDAKKGHIVFYDDIYGEDKQLRNRYFANKPII